MTTPTPSALAAAANSNDDSLPPDPESTDPALYQNMDFYAWLADQPGTRKRHRGG
jgi:hypothetical protein